MATDSAQSTFLAADKKSGTLTGTAGPDIFVLSQGQGSVIITNFSIESDILDFGNLGFASQNAVLAAAQQVGADTVITLGGGAMLTLRNIPKASLTEAHIGLDHSLAASAAPTKWFNSSQIGSTLSGTGGNDALNTNVATITLAGGAGDDTYGVAHDSVTIVERAGEGIDTVNSWASFTLSANLDNLVLQGSVNLNATGNELDNRIVGNTGDNMLDGGDGNDVLTGGAGSDIFVMRRGGGLDVVTDFSAKGTKPDLLSIEQYSYVNFEALRPKMTQVGPDVVIALSESDTVVLNGVSLADLSAGNFRFVALDAPQTISGTAKADVLAGAAGADTITGGRGDDRLTGGDGSDTLVFAKGDGSDTVTDFTAGAGGDVLDLRGYGFTGFAGVAAAARQIGADTVIDLGGGEKLTLANVMAASLTKENVSLGLALTTSGGVSSWFTTAEASTVAGTAGNDALNTNIGTAKLAGGTGDDIYGIAHTSVEITEKAGEGIDTVSSWASFTLSANLENLALQGSVNLNGTGNALDNLITGNAGDNILTGGAGNDQLTGGGGSDTFVFRAGDGADVITDFQAAGKGADILRLENFAFASFADLSGRMWQSGKDVTIGLSATETITLKNVDLAALTAANFRFAPMVAPQTLIGTDRADTLAGGAGNDVIAGGRGSDTLSGGAGRDMFVFAAGDGSDVVTDFAAGAGGDTLRLQNYGLASFYAVTTAARQIGSDTVISLGNGETLTLKNVLASTLTPDNIVLDYALPTSGGVSKWLVAGTSGTLNGTAGNDQLAAGVGSAVLAGGAGDDSYQVSAGVTVVEKAGAGIDTVYAYMPERYILPENVENLVLASNTDAWAMGNDLANIIKGSAGDNTLIGAGGNDILTGGGGRDIFVVRQGDGSDVITDFTVTGSGRDIVRFDGLGLGSFAKVKAATKQVGADAVIDLGQGQSLTLRNVDAAKLTAENFGLAIDTSTMARTFFDDFDSFARVQNGQGTWSTKYVYGGVNAYMLNNEEQLYVDPDFRGLPGSQSATSLGLDPFSIEDGRLVITAAPFSDTAKPYVGDFSHSSGVITTQTSFYQTYGYFEIKAEIPNVAGAWPAFWMLQNDKWPPELDILEYIGGRDDALTSGTRSTTGDDMRWQWVEDLTQGEHTFGTLWTPYSIDIYVDDRLVSRYATPEDMNGPMYLIANLAMGDAWAGSPAADAVAQFKINAISAYQLTEYTLAGYKLTETAAATNMIYGTAAGQTLTGTTAADLLDGRGGADRLIGGAGDDTYVVSTAGTVIEEKAGEGIDLVRSSVSVTLGDNLDNLTLTGSAAIDGTGNGGANIITGNDARNTITGGLGNDVLTGGGGNDVFVVSKGDGSDIVTDFADGDRVQLNGFWFSTFDDVRSALSQHGSDTYLTLDALETLVFRNHQVGDFTASDFALPGQPPVSATAAHWLSSSSSAAAVYGTPSNENLSGSGPLVGGNGDDTYVAGAGTQVFEHANEGVDTVESWLGSYTLGVNVENLTMKVAGSGIGNEFANRVVGSSGNDIINGKGGNDWLTGGAGRDMFVFDNAPSENDVDTITDFVSGIDSLVLARSAFSGLGTASSSSAFYAGAQAHAATDRIVYDSATGNVYYDSDGTGADPAQMILHLQPQTKLAVADILFV